MHIVRIRLTHDLILYTRVSLITFSRRVREKTLLTALFCPPGKSLSVRGQEIGRKIQDSYGDTEIKNLNSDIEDNVMPSSKRFQ